MSHEKSNNSKPTGLESGEQECRHTFYLAPMLGITDASFRSAFMQTFGGFDLAISPFTKTLQGQRYKESKVVDLLPRYNQSISLHPQIMSNNSKDFLHLAAVLFDLGYETVNLNLGCPMPTTAGRSCGAGLIPEVDIIDRLLDEALPRMRNRLSIKTRVGLTSNQQLSRLIPVLNRYPLKEVIIHPRTAAQKYSGEVDHEAFSQACKALVHPVVYSGDICTKSDFVALKGRYPDITHWMIGRGILKNPYLIQELKNGFKKGSIPDFFDQLTYLYRQRQLSEHIILRRLQVLGSYLTLGSLVDMRNVRSLRKSRSPESYIGTIGSVLSMGSDFS